MADTVGAAQLEISADVSGVETGITKAKKSIAGLADAARTAGKGAADGLDGIGEGAKGAAGKVDASTRNMIGSIQRQIAAMEAGSKSGSDYYRALASQRGVSADALKPYLDQLDQATAKQAATAAAAASGAASFNKVGVSAAQAAAAMRQVPAQLTDIIVGLQSGQAPLTVLLQQGGQLKDMFGGVVPAARALGTAVMGLINPYTLAAAAVAGLAVAYNEGSKEADAFARALILTNNAAGLSLGQLQQMAERISAVSGTQYQAAAALAAFASSTALAGADIEKFAAAAARMERITGQAVGETVKQFEELAKNPVEASVKLNEKTNFLTESLYRQIKALDEQGKTAQAAAMAMNALADDAERKMASLEARLGYVERAWKAMGSAAKSAWDDVLNIGRPETLEGRLASAQKVLQDYQTTLPGRRTTEQTAAVQKFGGEEGLKNHIAGLKELIDTQDKSAKMEADAAQKVAARIAFDKEADKYLSKKVQMTRELAKAEELATKAGATRAEKEALFANIRDKYKETSTSTARVDAAAQAKLDIEAIKSASEQRVNAYANGERMLEATRQAGLISEAEYWDAKRQFLRINTDEQIAALNAENARLETQKLNTKDALDRDRQVLTNKTKIAGLLNTLGTNQYLLDLQETAAINAKAAALLTARQAAEAYLGTQVRQQQLDLQGIGQGTVNRNLNRGLAQIEDRYAGQRLELANQRALLEMEGKFTEEARKQYDARLGIIEEFKEKSLASYRDYYQQLMDAQGSWALGANEALNNYLSGAQNVFTQTEQAVGSAFRGMEDALVQFVTTGKLNFSNLATSIVADITRIIIKQQIANALMSVMGGSFGTGLANLLPGDPLDNLIGLTGGFAGRATGGPVSAGGIYQVNENGPELLNVGNKQYLMMGNQAGSVTPSGAGGQGGGRAQTITVNVQMPPGANRQTGLQFGQAVAKQLAVASNRNG